MSTSDKLLRDRYAPIAMQYIAAMHIAAMQIADKHGQEFKLEWPMVAQSVMALTDELIAERNKEGAA